jgi:hypothetical protein
MLDTRVLDNIKHNRNEIIKHIYIQDLPNMGPNIKILTSSKISDIIQRPSNL